MQTEWSPYWQDVRNLRWTDIDQEVLEKVANTLGWGPDRTLLEIGAGRGLHSKQLYEMMRCQRPDLYEVCPETLLYIKRMGLNALGDEADMKRHYDIVWSSGVPEHFEEPMRQQIIDQHFERSREWVVLVIPRNTWLRRAIGRRDRIPARDFTGEELVERLRRGASKHWADAGTDIEFHVESFCPLFGVRHVPKGMYNLIDRLIGWALPGGQLLGWARKGQSAVLPTQPRP